MQKSRWAQPETSSKTTRTKETIAHAPAPTPSVQPTSSSTLSAAAIEFSPTPAAPSEPEPSYDEFAQTGAGQEDLFDDVTESMQTRPQDDLFGDDFTPIPEPIVEPTPAEAVAPQIAPTRGEPRARGRGRTRGGVARTEQRQEQPQAPENAPTGPKKEVQSAVRGDRHATGGVKKPKLSEAELAEKMAAITIKNASLAAAHARAEADAASFEQREAQAKIDASKRSEAAKVRANEERKDRQQMNGEREKNRLRKLKAMEGREWDAEKDTNDFTNGGRHDKKGSFAGDQADYTDGREYLLRDAKAPRGGKRQNERKPQESVPRKEDFPALPAPSTSLVKTDDIAGKSWADQVEQSTTSVS